jgi:hypothetical protein
MERYPLASSLLCQRAVSVIHVEDAAILRGATGSREEGSSSARQSVTRRAYFPARGTGAVAGFRWKTQRKEQAMKKYSLVAGMAFALMFATSSAFALADYGQKASTPKAAATTHEMSHTTTATVQGKVEVRTEKIGSKEMTNVRLRVASAIGPDGKALPSLKGRDLQVVGPKHDELAKFAGKDCEVQGSLIRDREIDATSCSPLHMPMPAATATPPAAPAAK